MSAPADVLAMMDELSGGADAAAEQFDYGTDERMQWVNQRDTLDAIRAAVAELVEASRNLLREVNLMGQGGTLETADLDAALAKFGGQS